MTSQMQIFCPFNDCVNPIEVGKDKCAQHKHRKLCKTELFFNQVYARGLCVRHGGKRDCQASNCSRNVRLGDFCVRHSSEVQKKIYCTEPNCSNVAYNRRKCVRHGGGRQCHVEGCTTHARSGGSCCRHSSIPNTTIISDDSLLKVIDQVMFNDCLEDEMAFLDTLLPQDAIFLNSSGFFELEF